MIDLSMMAGLSHYVDLTDYNFLFAAACIIFNPLFWNVVARWEYRTQALSRVFGSPYVACYILGVLIIFLAFFRSHWATLHVLRYDASGYQALVFLTGALSTSFPGSSDYRGDYFGILMEEKVTGFPFNIMENPMYWGSTANYLGLALMPFTEQIYRRKAKTKKYR
ncbi:phosphatidylethanolamine N-methyltransferase isoform X5 [Dendrobates tinctorius]|uniref:phosphatidylethanolamine N-methyltransferase isoform X5 n=1 Tax=Dendrobates tinctorius TaxID=92724 RepID=UPI003CC92C2B